MRYTLPLLFFLLISCSGEELNESIIMPSTPVLTVQTYWGVVNSSYIRVTDKNDRYNKIITTLRKGDIVEILSKETEKGSGKKAYWYEVKIDHIIGVVPEVVIELYNSRAKASNASREM